MQATQIFLFFMGLKGVFERITQYVTNIFVRDKKLNKKF